MFHYDPRMIPININMNMNIMHEQNNIKNTIPNHKANTKTSFYTVTTGLLLLSVKQETLVRSITLLFEQCLQRV